MTFMIITDCFLSFLSTSIKREDRNAKREQAHVSCAVNGDPEGPQQDVLG